MYVNELPSKVLSSVHMYADDVQLYKSCPLGMIEDGAHAINNDLDSISTWSEENGLFLNPLKTKCLVISKKVLDLSYFPDINLKGSKINYVEKAKNLGIVFNRTLTWNDHINSTIGKVYGVLRKLWMSHNYTPQKIRMLLAKTLILPILSYGCEIFRNCDASSKRKLNVAFNNTVRYVFNLRRFDRVSNYSKLILNMPFDHLLAYRALVLLSNVIETRQPSYLFDKLRFGSSSRSHQLIYPRFTCLTSERQFLVSSIRLWNSLPGQIRRCGGTERFRIELKAHYSN